MEGAMGEYRKLPQPEYDKAKGQLRLQLNGVLKPFNMYGLGIFIPGAIDECVHLAEQFAMRIRGKDIPIRRRSNHWGFD